MGWVAACTACARCGAARLTWLFHAVLCARGPRRPAAAPQTRPTAAAAPGASGGGMMSGIGSTIVQGMAFGTGSAIAHRYVRWCGPVGREFAHVHLV